ncbi:protein AF-17-like [Gadus macrocephalus]|uniref:protein AF-17-like n=1 Tax=Gadus macrocephalus TaxID=80720 RepID=UPI0028CB6D84|nr:protein AF-17-like [Gadus macrocephalus]
MREMVGGCCVCSDERGWAENPLVYCDGHGCSVAVHQACYGIVQVPTGPWFCRKCESQERAARVRCELCPHKDGALKRTDSGGWAHVVCALYIPEVQFANVLTMEPIVLQYVPHDRYIKTCCICEDHGRESKAACGACMTCNRQGCRQAFHVTCAQMAGLLCEEEGPEADNVKYCGYCKHHYSKMQKKLRSSENTGGTFSHPRGAPSPPSQDKHHHHKQRKSHKDKTRPKERHKKSSDGLGSLGTGSIDKVGAPQRPRPDALIHLSPLSSSHHIGSKDSEGKSKKLSSHGLPHRSKKTGSNGKSCSSSSCSSSPFNTGNSLSAQDFHHFSSPSSSRPERDHERGAAGEHSGTEERREERREERKEEQEEEEEEEKAEEKDEEDDDEEEEDSKYHKPPALTPMEGPPSGPQGHERPEGHGSPFETKVTISTFGSIMRITSSSALGSSSKIRKISSSSSSGEHKPSRSLGKPSHLTTPPIPEEADPEGQATPPPPPPPPRERRHRGSKKSRHGPGRPRGSKNRERRGAGVGGGGEGEERHHHRHGSAPSPAPPTTAPPTPGSSSSLYSSTMPSAAPHPAFPSGLPPLANNAFSSSSTSSSSTSSFTSSLSSTSVAGSCFSGGFSASRGSALLGSGMYPSLKDPLSLGGGVCGPPLSLGGGLCSSTSLSLGGGLCSSTSLSLGGGVCSTALSTGLLPSHVATLSFPSVSPAAHTRAPPGSTSSSYSLTSVQPFANCFTAAPSLPPLLSQAQTSLPESDLDDCRFPCQANSPTESLSSQSPMSCLPLLFDLRDGLGLGLGARPENVPAASAHIELLLEKHGNGEMGVNIVDMLQSLHSLQQENQRLQDQILGLAAKKERLQLLNVDLAAPFPPHGHPGSLYASAQVNFLSSAHETLCSNKSPLSKACFLNDTSFVTSSEELHSGSPSRSSSSLSFQSTPPPQPSPAPFGQPLMNGLGRGGLCDGLLGGGGGHSALALAGSPQLGLGGGGGALGGLNGVIQSPAHNAPPQPALPALRPQPPPLNAQALAQGLQLPKSLSPSSMLSEQQKQLLLQQQQQQLQQFLTSQNFTPEQQVVVYQMLQQQRQRELQRLSLTGGLSSTSASNMIAQSPVLLSSSTTTTPPLLPGSQGNGAGLFGLQDTALHKTGAAGEKGGDKNG